MAPVGEAYENPAFHLQGTGGTSVRVHAAAAPGRSGGARDAEAGGGRALGVPVAERYAAGGRVVHGPKGQIARYGELPRRPRARVAGRAAAQEQGPVPPDRPAGAPPRSSGEGPRQAVFGIDVRVPDMVYAAIRQSPVFGGKVESIANRAEVEAGVLAVVPLDDAVAVVAEHFWQAKTAADALEVAWDEAPAQGRRRGDHGAVPLEDRRRSSDRVRARRGRARAGRRGQGGRGGIRAAVPRARHDGADERDRARHRGAG